MSETEARPPARLVEFVTRYEMVWHVITVTVFFLSLVLVVVVFPDVSNLWVSIFVLVGGATSSVAAMIAAIKSR